MRAGANDLGETAPWRYLDSMRRGMTSCITARTALLMHLAGREMLDQRAAVSDIEQLHSAANGQDRKIRCKRFGEQIGLHLVALFVDPLRSVGSLPVARRVNVASSRQQESVEPSQMSRL